MARTAPVRIGDPDGCWQPPVDPDKPPEEYAREHALEAVHELLQLMRHSDSEKVRLKSATVLLDRGLGRAVARVEQVSKSDPLGIDAVRAAAREMLTDPLVRSEVRAALRGEPEA